MTPELLESIPIQLPNGIVLEGTAPLVLIGPNGAGKTRFGTNLVNQFNYDRVPALRSLSFGHNISYLRNDEAKQQADNQINQNRANPWQLSNDVDAILAEIKADDAQYAVDYRNTVSSQGYTGPPELTKLQRLIRIWGSIFPGRELDLSTYAPMASWNHADRSTGKYGANQMSDGERSALYLIGRVLRSAPGVVIIDEPEVHFHPLLARAFWDTMEVERADCRFVYITHDLPFALSRGRARIGIVRSETEVELVPENAPIPPEIYESILGAASLSVVAKRIVFCEGKFDRSIDVHVYGAWFQAPESVIVPVGSCSEVQQAVAVFKANPLIANAVPLGLVERDYWPVSHLDKLTADGLSVLPAHEIEGLLCLPGVAEAVATHLAAPEFAATYQKFEQEIRQYFHGVRLNKLALERAKRDVDCRLVGLANSANPSPDAAQTRLNFTQTVDLGRAVADVGALFDEHLSLATTALAGPFLEFLKIFPGKDCLAVLCRNLGVTKEAYLNLIVRALTQPDSGGDPALEALRSALVTALRPHLPSRTITQ